MGRPQLSVILLVAGLMFATPLPAQMPSQPQSDGQRTEAPPNKNEAEPSASARGTKNAPLVVELMRSKEDQANSAYEERARSEQAVTDEKLTEYTWYLSAWTLGLFVFAGIQLALFYGQLRSIFDQGRLAREEFDATHRPWVSPIDAVMEGPLIFNDHGAHMPITFVVKNFGGSPALNVRVSTRAIPMGGHAFIQQTHALVEGDFAQGQKEHPEPEPFLGYTIFPGGEVRIGGMLSLSKAEIAKATEYLPTKFLLPAVVGQLRYNFTFGKKKGVTRFAFGLTAGTYGMAVSGISMDKSEIPVENLSLMQEHTGWNAS